MSANPPANTQTNAQLAAVAAGHLRAGRMEAGIDAYQRLLASNPDLPDAWYNLGYLQRCTRKFDDALDAYGKAVALGVARPEEAHVNRAAILSEHLDDDKGAEQALRDALEANPGFVIAWLNLGNLYEDRGEPEHARDAYRSVLEIVPHHGRALARLTAIDIFEGEAPAVLSRIREALDTLGPSPEDKVELTFALGHALDAVGEYDEAFARFRAANDLSRQIVRGQTGYDRAVQERLVAALVDAPTLPVLAQLSGEAAPPLFICGMFRSGSTLAEQILARHSRVIAGGELDFLPALVREHLSPYPQALASASVQSLEALRAQYLDDLRTRHPRYNIITDKRPDNFQYIGLIKTLFPDAKIVHTTRHPIDTMLSIYFLYFDDSISYGASIDDIAHYYRCYRDLMRHWKVQYGSDIYELDYDALVDQPEVAVRPLLAFAGLDWEEVCLGEQGSANTVKTASAWQVRQPLHRRSSGRWKNYRAHIGELLAEFGER